MDMGFERTVVVVVTVRVAFLFNLYSLHFFISLQSLEISIRVDREREGGIYDEGMNRVVVVSCMLVVSLFKKVS